MRESDNRPVYYKDLTLITSELANSFGIPTEAPVFASPHHRGVIQCPLPWCRKEFTPLVYSALQIVEAQHFHPRFQVGGIYFYQGREGNHGLKFHSGWIAIVEPQGEIVAEPFGLIARQVRVGQIVPYCIALNSSSAERMCGRRLEEGLAVESTFPENRHYLGPVCGQACLDSLQRFSGLSFSYNPRFKFKVTEDGRVVFGNLRD